MGKIVKKSVLILLVGLFTLFAPLYAQDGNKVVVLDTFGSWRIYNVMKPPVIQTHSGLKKALSVRNKESRGSKAGYEYQPWMHVETPEPPKGWEAPDFDDGKWRRGTARHATNTEFLARLCLRGKFLVTDPAKVKDLKLDLGYYGGAIVYINGKELERGHLKKGDEGRNGLAEIYPEDAYYYGGTGKKYFRSGKAKEMGKIRTRKLENIAVPPKLLRKGVNVLAIELIRPPERKSTQIENFKVGGHKYVPYRFTWITCSLRYVQLAAAGSGGVVPNAVRPDGFQVWNSNLLADDFTVDFGDPTEKLRPIEIIGAKNGSFSGKVVVGQNKAINNLKATISDLKGDGTIPASAVRIRYGVPWATASANDSAALFGRYSLTPRYIGALEEFPLPEIPVRQATASAYRRTHGHYLVTPDQPKPVFGAVASVWMTIDVPAGAKAGKYTGELTIQAQGVKPVKVPVNLIVEDWKLPDTQDYDTWVGLIQSPDTLVLEYKVMPWSDEHFKLIAKSMKHMGRSGCRLLYIPVICHTNMGNDESIVRWIEKGDYKYDWDFSIMDKYLDTAEKNMGKPKIVCFWVWDKFMFPTVEDPRTYERYRVKERENKPRAVTGLAEYLGKGPMVTMLDPATGKMEKQHLPYLLLPESKGIWKSLIGKLKERMKKRGIEDAMMLGCGSDIVLRKPHFDFFKEVGPGYKWVNHSHFDVKSIYKANGFELGYYSTVMNIWFPGNPEDGRKRTSRGKEYHVPYGWQRKELHTHLGSRWGRYNFTSTICRLMAEINVAGSQRGLGRLGADIWSLKNNKGRRKREGGAGIASRYPESSWRSNDICQSMFAPGKDGAIETIRYAMLREGVQETEARIFVEKAIVEKKITGDLAKRCQEVLDERLRYMIRGMSDYQYDTYFAGYTSNGSDSWWRVPKHVYGHIWYINTGWEARSQKLFRVAGEVAAKLGTK